MPDVTVFDDDSARIVGLYKHAVTVQRLNSGDFGLVLDDIFAALTPSQLAQFSELLRRMAAGEPLQDEPAQKGQP